MYWQEIKVRGPAMSQEPMLAVLLDIATDGLSVEQDKDDDECTTLRCYVREPLNNIQLDRLRQRLVGLSKYGFSTQGLQLHVRQISDEDWENQWKQDYRPLTLGKLTVAPTWRPDATSLEHTIILDPGMAFGTGQHPTTQLCILLLQELELSGRAVWDVGTGSGIVAIAASKLGASVVKAADIDALAVTVAKENCARNGAEVTLVHGPIEQLSGTVDVVVANIGPQVVMDLLVAVTPRLKPGGHFLASGISCKRGAQVEAFARTLGYEVLLQQIMGPWVGYIFSRKE